MMRALLILLALNPAAVLSASEPPPWSVMPAGEGRRETFAVCSACHSIKLVEQQGMTRPQWAETLYYMVDEHGMAELSPDLLDRILDYLAFAYSPDRPNWKPDG